MPKVILTASSPQLNVINGTEQPDGAFGTPGPDLINGFGGDWLMAKAATILSEVVKTGTFCSVDWAMTGSRVTRATIS